MRLADLYCTLEQAGPAEKCLEEYLDGLLKRQLRFSWRIPVDVEVELLALRCQSLRGGDAPPSWQYYDTQRLLGLAMIARQRFDAAELKLVEAYRELAARRDTIPEAVRGERLAASASALSRLYTTWGQANMAAKWRQAAGAHEKKR